MNGWLEPRGVFHVITCSHLEFAEMRNHTEESLIKEGWIKVQRINEKFRTYDIKPIVTYDKINRCQLDFLFDSEFINYRFQLHGDHSTIGWLQFLENVERVV